jgi:hypothetical protein
VASHNTSQSCAWVARRPVGRRFVSGPVAKAQKLSIELREHPGVLAIQNHLAQSRCGWLSGVAHGCNARRRRRGRTSQAADNVSVRALRDEDRVAWVPECVVHLHGPEPGEQSSRQSGFHSTGVVHDLAFLLIHCQALGEMQRNVGLPQHVFGGVAQPKVGTEGQRGEEFGSLVRRKLPGPDCQAAKELCQEANGLVETVDSANHVGPSTIGRQVALPVKFISIHHGETES